MIYKTDLNAFTAWEFQWKTILLLWDWNNSVAHEVIYWMITCFFTEDNLTHKRSLKYCSFVKQGNTKYVNYCGFTQWKVKKKISAELVRIFQEIFNQKDLT